MIHESSCTSAPQQNSVAEKNNRHIIETVHTLMLQMNISKPFWGDAVLTACHLINRMPSPVLNGKVPYNVLFPSRYNPRMCYFN